MLNIRKGYTMKKAENVKELIATCDLHQLEYPKNLDDFYVDTSEARGINAVERLQTILTYGTQENKKILFMGHHGCGKSTELVMAAAALRKDNYEVVEISAGLYLNNLSASYVDIILVLLDGIIRYSENHNVSLNQNKLREIFYYWNDERILSMSCEHKADVDAEIEASGGVIGFLLAKIRGHFQASASVKEETIRNLDHSIPDFIELINSFLKDFSKKLNNKKFIILMDEVDKVIISQAEDIFVNHYKHLIAIDATIVFTFPIALYYSPKFRAIEHEYTSTILLSMIKVKKIDGTDFEIGRNTLKEIICKRADEELFDKDVLGFIITKSGGSIRTALKLIINAAIDKPNQQTISMDMIQKSYMSHRSDMSRIIRKEHLDILINVHETKQPLVEQDNDLLMDLLMSLAVIEYNGERWCDLNPAVEDYLSDLGKI